jgi:hypothetical protein
MPIPNRQRKPHTHTKANELRLRDLTTHIACGKQWRTPPDSNDTWRIFTSNIHGMKYQQDWDYFDILLNSGYRFGINTFCLSESNTDWKYGEIRTQMHSNLRRLAKSYRISPSQSTIRFNTHYQPGGTLSLTTGPLSGRTKTTTGDAKGRWNTLLINGSGGNSVALITAYVPPLRYNDTYGPSTYMAQLSLSTLQEGKSMTAAELINQLYEDLAQEIKNHQTQHREVLLTGDFNAPVFGESAKAFLDSLAMVDIMETYVGRAPVNETQHGSRLTWLAGTQGIARASTASYMLLPNTIVSSDHRGYLIDIDLKSLFGPEKYHFQHIKNQTLRSGPKTSKIYLRKVARWLETNHIRAQLESIATLDKEGAEKETNKIDQSFTAARLRAERQCTKERAPWSPALHQAYLTHQYWAAARKKGTNSLKCLEISEALKWTATSDTVDHATIRAKYHQSLRTLQKRRQMSETLRLAYLGDQLGKASSTHDRERYQGLINDLHIKNAYSKLRWAQGKMDKAGLTELHIERPDGTIEILQNTHQIEQHLLHVRQPNHFGQSEGTPLTKEPYRSWLGVDTNTEWANRVVQGETFPPTDPDINKLWTTIQHIQQTRYGQAISNQDFVATIKKVNEASAPSASGLHYGHYKCLVKGAPCSDDNERKTMESYQQTILDTITTILNICLHHGFPLERWLKITSVMIPKQTGNYQTPDYPLVRSRLPAADIRNNNNKGNPPIRNVRRPTPTVIRQPLRPEHLGLRSLQDPHPRRLCSHTKNGCHRRYRCKILL